MRTHSIGTHHHFTRLFVLGIGAVVTVIITASLLREQREDVGSPVPCTPLPFAASIARADLILTGEVFLVVPADPGFATVLITPLRVYKGNVSAQGIRIRALADAPITGVASDDLHFASGQTPYLLFLQQQPDGVYRTSKCVGSRLLGGELTVEEQEALGQ